LPVRESLAQMLGSTLLMLSIVPMSVAIWSFALGVAA
jgi:hypothetical protein